MTLQDLGICFTAIISSVSLYISIANHWRSKPKLKLKITDKNWDCFFGLANSCYVAGAKISIVNNSPVSITINKINLVVKKEKLRLIDKRNPYWSGVEFYYNDCNGNLTMDLAGINYAESGIELPYKLNAYDTLTVHVLFHDFPVKIKGKCKGKLVMDTAIGNVSKRVTLVEYDRNYQNEDYRDYLQYCRNSKEEQ